MNERAGASALLAMCGLLSLVACDDDGPAEVATSLCPTAQAWSDLSVDAVDAFRIASRELDQAQRRARYAQAFDELEALQDRFGEELDDAGPARRRPEPDSIKRSPRWRAKFDDGRAEAEGFRIRRMSSSPSAMARS